MKLNIEKTEKGKLKINYGTTLYKAGSRLINKATYTTLTEEYVVEHVGSREFDSINELNSFISMLESNLKQLAPKEEE